MSRLKIESAYETARNFNAKIVHALKVITGHQFRIMTLELF